MAIESRRPISSVGILPDTSYEPSSRCAASGSIGPWAFLVAPRDRLQKIGIGHDPFEMTVFVMKQPGDIAAGRHDGPGGAVAEAHHARDHRSLARLYDTGALSVGN